MKVFIIAALVLVAQCQLQPVPAQRGEERHKIDEHGRKPEDARKVVDQHKFVLPTFPDDMIKQDMEFFKDYTTMRNTERQQGRQDDPRKVVFIAAIKNEAYERLLQGKENPLKDPKNRDLLVNLYRKHSSETKFNKDDEKLTKPEGVIIKNLLDEDMTIEKDLRSGVFTLNDIRAELLGAEGENVILMLDDFFEDVKLKITELIQREGRTGEERPIVGHGAGTGGQDDVRRGDEAIRGGGERPQ